MKGNHRSEVFMISEPAGEALYRLYGGVESLTWPVGDWVPEPGNDAFDVGEDHVSDALERG